MNKVKALVITTVFIDIIGVGIIIPVLPYYVKSFGASDIAVTALVVVFACLSFISAPILGAWSDKWGRRPVLIASITSTAIGWLIFAWAPSIIWLFVGRAIDGLAAGNITAAQSSLADIARDEKERTKNMGMIGALFGIGLIIGPVLGGILGSWGHSVPFWFVGCLAAVNAVLAFFFLPETHQTKDSGKKVSLNPLNPITDGFKNREMRELFLVWFLFGVVVAVQHSTFALYMAKVFGTKESILGIIFGGIGIMILLNQVVFLNRVWLRYFKQKTLAFSMLITLSIGMIITAVPTLVAVGIGLILTTFSQGNLRAVFGSMIAGYNPNKRGEYIGISMSIMSLSMIIGPLVTTITFGVSPFLPFFIAGGIGFCAVMIMKFFPIKHH